MNQQAPIKAMAEPSVSVVLLPAQEGFSEGIAEAMGSVEAQTFRDFEVVVCDRRQTVAARRNEGVQRARGEYLAFLDGDQLWHARKLEKQMALLAENPNRQWCYCGAEGSATGYAPEGEILRPLLLNNFIPASSVVVRRAALMEAGGFEDAAGERFSADWDMWLRIAARHVASVVREPLVQLQRQMAEIEQMYGSRLRVVEATVARDQTLLDLRSEAMAEICVSAGNRYLDENKPSNARHKFAEALTHNPMRPDAYLSWVSSFFPVEAQQQIRDLQGLSKFTQARR